MVTTSINDQNIKSWSKYTVIIPVENHCSRYTHIYIEITFGRSSTGLEILLGDLTIRIRKWFNISYDELPVSPIIIITIFSSTTISSFYWTPPFLLSSMSFLHSFSSLSSFSSASVFSSGSLSWTTHAAMLLSVSPTTRLTIAAIRPLWLPCRRRFSATLFSFFLYSTPGVVEGREFSSGTANVPLLTTLFLPPVDLNTRLNRRF